MILYMSQQTPVRLLFGKEKSESDSQLRYAKLPGALKPQQKSPVLPFSDFINIFYMRQTENIVSSRRFVLLSTLFYTTSCHPRWVFALEDFPENPAENLILCQNR